MKRRCLLVTGAGGFIGRWCLAPVRKLGYEVHGAISPASGNKYQTIEQLQGYPLHRVDLFDCRAVSKLLEDVRPTHLLHLAWDAKRGYWTSLGNFSWVAASLTLLHRFQEQGGERAVFAGTCAEYDWQIAGKCIEGQTPLAEPGGPTVTPYASCKIALSKLIKSFSRESSLSTAWGRIFFQYGPYESQDRLVSYVISSLLRGEPANCTHGNQIRSFLHVSDVARAFAALVDVPVTGEVNIGSAEPITIAELTSRIAEEIGRRQLLRLGAKPSPKGEPLELVPSIERLQSATGWRPSYSMTTGLRDTIAWWKRELGI